MTLLSQLGVVHHLELPPGIETGQLDLQPFQTADDLFLERVVEILQLLGGTLEDNGFLVEGQNPVRDEIDIRYFMADHDRGESELPLILGDHPQDRVFPDRILSGCGFIEQDDSRIGHQSPRQRDPLLHASRDFRRVFVDRILQFRLFDSGHHPAIDFIFVQARRFAKRKGDVIVDVYGVEERVVLKHVADPGETGGSLFFVHVVQRFPLEENGSLVRPDQTDDVLEEHAFSRTAQPDDGRHLTFVDLQVDSIQDGPGIEALGDIPEFDQRFIHIVLRSAGRSQRSRTPGSERRRARRKRSSKTRRPSRRGCLNACVRSSPGNRRPWRQ